MARKLELAVNRKRVLRVMRERKLIQRLKPRRFTPTVREVIDPQTNGKLRRLGIPTAADRLVQASLKLVPAPIFEADFEPSSYRCRPKRRAQNAIA